MLGNGSDGDLYVASGQTVNLQLDRKYQYRNITVEAGGTLSTTNTTGSVLYLLATGVVTISGTINLSGKVNRGQNSWSTTIDGATYSSPSCSQGGSGGWWSGQPAPAAGQNGYGGGGSGGLQDDNDPSYRVVSAGGAGGANPNNGGGASAHAGNSGGSFNISANNGGNGSQSGGGGGGAVAWWRATAGSGTINVYGYTGGSGGNSHGANGGNGANPAGRKEFASTVGGSSYFASLGGGGAGGIAGRPGVHLVIKASEVILNSGGTINLSGTNGGNGGNGGISYYWNGQLSSGGLGGGGGGGGWGGNAYIYYGTRLVNSITWNRAGGSGGSSGVVGGSGASSGGAGSSGATGGLVTGRAGAWYGNMLTMFQ